MKLVRDHIDKLPWKWEETKGLLRPTTDRNEHMGLLIAKFMEEGAEFILADTEGGMVEEAADVMQVMMDRIHVASFYPELTPGELETRICVARLSKYKQRGGFSTGLVFDP